MFTHRLTRTNGAWGEGQRKRDCYNLRFSSCCPPILLVAHASNNNNSKGSNNEQLTVEQLMDELGSPSEQALGMLVLSSFYRCKRSEEDGHACKLGEQVLELVQSRQLALLLQSIPPLWMGWGAKIWRLFAPARDKSPHFWDKFSHL